MNRYPVKPLIPVFSPSTLSWRKPGFRGSYPVKQFFGVRREYLASRAHEAAERGAERGADTLADLALARIRGYEGGGS